MSAKAPVLVPANTADWDDAVRESQSARIVFEFYNGSGSTISDGLVVALDLTDSDRLGTAIKLAAATDDLASVVGFADEDILDGQMGNVVVYGVKQDVTSDGTLTSGDGVQVSAGTAGTVEKAAADTDRRIGFALANDVATAGDVFVTCMG